MINVQAALTGVLLGGLYALMAAGAVGHLGRAAGHQPGPLRPDPARRLPHVPARHRPGARPAAHAGWSPCRRCSLLGGAGAVGLRPLGITELNSLLLSFGLLIVIVQAVSNIWTADFQRMTADVNPYATQSVRARPARLPAHRRCSRSASRSCSSAARIWRCGARSPGRALRAFAAGPDGRRGVRHRPPPHRHPARRRSPARRAAVAGMLFALASALTPATAFEWFGTVFAVVILGGIGHVLGTLVAGLLVGAAVRRGVRAGCRRPPRRSCCSP